MRRNCGIAVTLATIVLALASCDGKRPDAGGDADAAPAASATASDKRTQMENATAGFVAFLQGMAGLAATNVADTVVLYVSDEGGGGRVGADAELRCPAGIDRQFLGRMLDSDPAVERQIHLLGHQGGEAGVGAP